MTKRIPLTGKYGEGKFALVDDADFELLSQRLWWCSEDGYATRRERGRSIRMHRQIMRPPDGVMVDHINRDPLDNRRENLRLATPAQNRRNSMADRGALSEHKGVSFHKKTGLWQANIGTDYLGLYLTEWDAATAYNQEAKRRYGRFAYLNEIPPAPGADDPPQVRKATRRTRNGKQTSIYKGVRKGSRRWQAHINVDGQFIMIGSFDDERLAGLAYDAAALKYIGPKATLNFPESWDDPIDIDRPIAVQATPKQGSNNRFKGVRSHKNARWSADIQRGGKRISLGSFPTEEEAARAYDAAAYAKGGKVIPLNFPEEWPNHYLATPTKDSNK